MRMSRWRKGTSSASGEQGQAVIIFAVALVIFLGFVGMSIDVGRYMWATSEMQNSVDAAALAGAQSMPNGTGPATTYATQYWDANKSEIVDAGENVTFAVTFPGGNRAVRVEATAEVPTYFLKFFGIDHWDVEAASKAESQVLDIALVLDVSGSMCFTSYPPVEGSGDAWKGIVMGPGRADPYSTFVFPKLAAAIPAGGGDSITITLNNVGVFNTTNSTSKGNLFGGYFDNDSTNRYHQVAPNGGRAGIIMIDQELFKITAVNSATNQLTVTRGQSRIDTGATTTKAAHAVGADVWANRSSFGSRDYCDMASLYEQTSSQDGPHQPFNSAMSNAQYFISLFNAAYDKIGVAHFSTTGSVDQGLTGTSFSSLVSTIDNFGYPTGGTNIAHGIAKGRSILNGTGKRPNAVKIIVVLTDGVPTNYCSGQDSTSDSYGAASCSGTSSGNINTCTTTTGVTHAINQAAESADQDIIVYTIGLGDSAIDCVLEDIAEAGGGTYYKAPTPAQLDEAFEAIAKMTHIGLTG
jgi:Flp pilus assembly protein TadG